MCPDGGKHIANGMGVHREVESEGSRRQISGLRNTNRIRHETWDKTAFQVKVQKLHGHVSVNTAGRWNESEGSYRGRSHGRVKTNGQHFSGQFAKIFLLKISCNF